MAFYEVRVYIYDGVTYCPNCAKCEDEFDPEWGVVYDGDFDESMYGMCCGTCHHSLACVHHLDHPCPECHQDDSGN